MQFGLVCRGFFSADNSPFNPALFNKAAKSVMEACEDRRTVLKVQRDYHYHVGVKS